jgi:hypothetical protein
MGVEPEAPTAGAEWAPGQAQLIVLEGTPHQLSELVLPPSKPKTREVAGLEPRFYPPPHT